MDIAPNEALLNLLARTEAERIALERQAHVVQRRLEATEGEVRRLTQENQRLRDAAQPSSVADQTPSLTERITAALPAPGVELRNHGWGSLTGLLRQIAVGETPDMTTVDRMLDAAQGDIGEHNGVDLMALLREWRAGQG